MAVTESQFERAEAQAKREREAGHVLSARYDRRRRRVAVRLNTGVEVLRFPWRWRKGSTAPRPKTWRRS